MDAFIEFSPERRTMLETLVSHDGVGEYSARLTFKRGDISWGLRRKLIAKRPYRDQQELYATNLGRELLTAGKAAEGE